MMVCCVCRFVMSHLVVVVHDSLMMQLGFHALELNPEAAATQVLGTETAAAFLLAFWQRLRPEVKLKVKVNVKVKVKQWASYQNCNSA